MGPKILDADPSDESLVGFRHDLTEKLWVWPCGQHAANWIVGRMNRGSLVWCGFGSIGELAGSNGRGDYRGEGKIKTYCGKFSVFGPVFVHRNCVFQADLV